MTVPVDEDRDHHQGPPTASVTLVEYGDYQCPYCGEAYPIVKRIQDTLRDDLRFVFRNFPLTQAHPNAQFAAEFAEAGGAQGKFWETHDFVYEHQGQLSDPERFLRAGCSALGLDSEAVERDLDQHAYLPRIREDFMGGVHSGVNGTPTFYVNGLRHDGSYELPVLLGAIRGAAPTPGRSTSGVARARGSERPRRREA